MPRKIEDNSKTRITYIRKATIDDLVDFADYISGAWAKTSLPRIVKSWEVYLDEESERIVFNGPLLDLKEIGKMFDRDKDFQAKRDKIGGQDCVLIKHSKIKGSYPGKCVGIATTESIELSTQIPGVVRKKVISWLPEYITTH